MEQYIKKSAIVAEIERRIKTNKECMLGLRNLDYYQGKVDALNDTISFLDTIEVKEVDIDALCVLANHLIACNAHGITPKYSDRELDFLEGLANNKTQKVE